jgi:hypothetical protein
MRLANEDQQAIGFSPAFWLFHYEYHGAGNNKNLINPNDLMYQPQIHRGNLNEGYYSEANGETDIPELGFGPDDNPDCVGAMFNSYVNRVDRTETNHFSLASYGINLTDGKYHTFTLTTQTELLPVDSFAKMASYVTKNKDTGYYYISKDGSAYANVQGVPLTTCNANGQPIHYASFMANQLI